ncbi:hypothetical protein YTPLAS18_17070 [Nitrospira sp.]|nr:hypothetical protein YTPLAS18_17070 [Nitrospira sp.]
MTKEAIVWLWNSLPARAKAAWRRKAARAGKPVQSYIRYAVQQMVQGNFDYDKPRSRSRA